MELQDGEVDHQVSLSNTFLQVVMQRVVLTLTS